MTLWEFYARDFLEKTDYWAADQMFKKLIDAQLSEGSRPLHSDFREFVRLQMNSHAERLVTAGDAQGAAALRRLERRILNGLEWDPSQRILSLPEEFDSPTLEELRGARARRIQERVTARRDAWAALRPASSPQCGNILGEALVRLFKSQRGQ